MHFRVQASFALHNPALSSAKAALLLVWSCTAEREGPEWALRSVRHKYWAGHGSLARTPCFSFCSLHLVLGVSKRVQSLDQQSMFLTDLLLILLILKLAKWTYLPNIGPHDLAPNMCLEPLTSLEGYLLF